jgi:hypothetical protein
MANNYRNIDHEELTKLAFQYCDSCIESLKHVATMKGPVDIKEKKAVDS